MKKFISGEALTCNYCDRVLLRDVKDSNARLDGEDYQRVLYIECKNCGGYALVLRTSEGEYCVDFWDGEEP